MHRAGAGRMLPAISPSGSLAITNQMVFPGVERQAPENSRPGVLLRGVATYSQC